MEYKDLKTKNITNPVVTEYVNSLYEYPKLSDFRKDAEEKGVPIITKEVEAFLKVQLEIIKPKKILEIGCAVGYSAVFFSSVTDAVVYTIEKDEKTYDIARENIEKFGFSNKIHVLLGDGEEAINMLSAGEIKDFDMVFIDAAKSHYKRFFDAALPLCTENVVIIGDNVLFQGKVASDEYDIGGKHKTNIRKLREFNEYITHDDRFTSVVLAIGDGVSITKLK